MRYVIFSLLLALIFACSEESKKVEKNVPQELEQDKPLTSIDRNGKYTEWYDGHEQIKMEGRQDEEGRRQGVWKLYTQDGIDLSITVYKDGAKDGHIIVRYPTGILRYSGRYAMDERIGEWKFYDESGQLVKTENFDTVK
jgi:antitoxin component YwqK of YwqJK toxin-antitoxin module